ncbi:MAG: DNA polymerase III subunit alpha [Verrucomicrobiales bacterium]|nr:DNA polymerase III subunit alpha [Verrucomicrobiales bacterium]
MSDSFVHLHLHTEYSLLDGAVKIADLMAKVNRCKMPAVAMTDHGNLYGAIDFYKQASKAGVKPIIGSEVYLSPGSMYEKKKVPGLPNAHHLTLLAKNAVGYENLVRLVSQAHLDGFYYKPRIDKEALNKYSEGIICLSGCINGEINYWIQQDQLDIAREKLSEFVDIYGKDDFYLEMHDHGMDQQRLCNRQLLEFCGEFSLKPVAANDVHFLNRKDHEAHDVLICIGTGKMVLDENRMRYSPEVHFKTAKEMRQLFKEVPVACDNTLEIAEKIDFDMVLDSTSSERYPEYEVNLASSREDYFRELCEEGLVERYGSERAKNDEELRNRLDYEIGIMERMGFVSYFLITWDFIKWAKDNKIPVGPGRGSAAGSLVAYVLGITDLDPLRYGLIFERFLNPERVSPPDVDVDFCQTRRPEVIEYVRQKYGEKCVSHIITFGTLGAKSVVRDVGRVMGWSYGEADRIAKMIPNELGITLTSARKKNPELKEAIASEPATEQLWEYSTFLEGLTRGVGIHAAGIVIGDCELDVHVPLTRGNENEVVTQYAMKPLTDLGMLKMDFLGLKTLTVIQDAVDIINIKQSNFDISNIPIDDKKTFALLNAGETCGVFQLESGGMVALCKQFGVNRIEDIIALIALYRPGPMELIPDFIDRKKGKKKVEYLHPLLEEVSKETHGILIYQEQVQKAANVLAGYSLGDADLLRRAMGKKDPDEMAKQRTIFVEGCKKFNEIADKKANGIFDLLEKFAGYGFNKSHSAAYGLISYQTAYLKANYPVEFMSALLSNEINNTDKISVFVEECKSMGIKVLPPDVNKSQLKFSPEYSEEDNIDSIRYGLAAIKNVGSAAMNLAVTERNQSGDYSSADDFARRLESRSVNKKILESLTKAGAFDFSEEERASIFSRIDTIISAASLAQKDRVSGQTSLFDEDTDYGSSQTNMFNNVEVEFEPWNEDEILAAERELLGFYVTGHPLDSYRAYFSSGNYRRLSELQDLRENKKYSFMGRIAGLEKMFTKKAGKPFAKLNFEEFTGQTEVMVWSEVFVRSTEVLQVGAVIELLGKVELDSRTETKRLTAEKITPISKPIVDSNSKIEESIVNESLLKPSDSLRNENQKPGVNVYLKSGVHDKSDLHKIRDILMDHPGDNTVRIQYTTSNGSTVWLKAGPRYLVNDCENLRAELANWMR